MGYGGFWEFTARICTPVMMGVVWWGGVKVGGPCVKVEGRGDNLGGVRGVLANDKVLFTKCDGFGAIFDVA